MSNEISLDSVTMSNILAVEKTILESFEQHKLPVKHHHINGVYARELFIPAGTLLTGKIHNAENIAVLAQGTIRICNGEAAKVIHAPCVMVDKPGTKRMGYAETDCTFITIHRTDAVGIEAIEDELVSSTFEEYEQKRKLLGKDS